MNVEKTQIKNNSIFKITTLVVVFILWSFLSPVTAFFWSVFLIWWAFRLDTHILGWVTVGFILAIPVAQYFHADARAEEVAVYVFFLLVIIVTLQIFEVRREEREESRRRALVVHEDILPAEQTEQGMIIKEETELPVVVDKDALQVAERKIGRAVPWKGPKNVKYPDLSL